MLPKVCRRPEDIPNGSARSRRRSSYSASSYPCPPHRPHVCAMAIIGRRRPVPTFRPRPRPRPRVPTRPRPRPRATRPGIAPPRRRLFRVHQVRAAHQIPPAGPSRGVHESLRVVPVQRPRDRRPAVPPPANLARFRSSLSSAPPSVVSVAVHDAKRDDILSASQPVPAPSSRTAASRARRRSHLSDSRYRPRTIAAGHTCRCSATPARTGWTGGLTLTAKKSPRGGEVGGGTGKRTVAYLHLDAELAELVGGELDGGAEAGEAPTSALGRSDSSARRPLSAEITLRQISGAPYHSAAAERSIRRDVRDVRSLRRPVARASSRSTRRHRVHAPIARAVAPSSSSSSSVRENDALPPFPAAGWAPTSQRTRARGRTGSPTTKSRSSTPRWRPRRRRGSTSDLTPDTFPLPTLATRLDGLRRELVPAAGSTCSGASRSTGTRRGRGARCFTAWARTWAGRARRTPAVTSSGTSGSGRRSERPDRPIYTTAPRNPSHRQRRHRGADVSREQRVGGRVEGRVLGGGVEPAGKDGADLALTLLEPSRWTERARCPRKRWRTTCRCFTGTASSPAKSTAAR